MPAGKGAVGKILAGVAIVVAAVFTGGAAIGLFGLAAPIAVSSILAPIGLSLIFGGVAELLTPTPKMPTVGGSVGGSSTEGRSTDQLKSFTFDKSNANTLQGEVVPVLYGERIVGALPVLSFGLELQNSL
jgi:predicted phage tail protein